MEESCRGEVQDGPPAPPGVPEHLDTVGAPAQPRENVLVSPMFLVRNTSDLLHQSAKEVTQSAKDVKQSAKEVSRQSSELLHQSAKEVKQSAKEVIRSGTQMSERLNDGIADVHSRHALVLKTTVPEVALIFPSGQAVDEEHPAIADLTITARAEVYRYGVQHRLMIAQLKEEKRMSCHNAAHQIQELLSIIDDSGILASKDAGLSLSWPLHNHDVSMAMLGVEIEELALGLETDGQGQSWSEGSTKASTIWRKRLGRLLRLLKFTTPPLEGMTSDAFEDQYGRGVEFLFAWSAFYVQQLWLLSAYAVFCMMMKRYVVDKHNTHYVRGALMVGVISWAVSVVLHSRWRFPRYRADRQNQAAPTSGEPPIEKPSNADGLTDRLKPRRSIMRLRDGEEVVELVSRNTWESGQQRLQRLATLVCIALPCMLLVLFACMVVLSGVTMLILHIIYIWGDCLDRHTDHHECRDSQQKWMWLGWAAEVSCDILCAIIFELLFPVGGLVSHWVARLRNYEFEVEEKFLSSMCELLLAAVERLGFVAALAFLFAPQWEEPLGTGDEILKDASCDDLLFGDASYFCYSRRLPKGVRRHVFQSLLKGPFIVAPFIGILIKVIIPRAAHYISTFLDRSLKYKYCIFLAPLRCVFRLVGVVFSYDGGAVSCLKYAFKGPHAFSSIPESNADKDSLTKALIQVKMKPFEVEDELMELEMSFLWVSFFASVEPFGVIVTTLAKLCEFHTDLTKMLIVRRRPIPVSDRLMRREMNTYASAVAVASVGWSAGLSLITYNDDLWKWGMLGPLMLVVVILWLLISAAAVTTLTNRQLKSGTPA